MKDPEFRFEAARDLVGILRVLYAEEKGVRSPSRKKLAIIREIGRALTAAIRLAAAHDAGTAPYRKALHDAEVAVRRVEEIFLQGMMPEEVPRHLRVAGRRVVGEPQRTGPTEREVKWAVGKLRR